MSRGRQVSAHDAMRFRQLIRQMIQEELAEFRLHKLVGPVDYIAASGGKYFADVFLNGASPKFQDAFSDFSKWTTVVGSFSVASGVVTGSGGAQDLAIVTGSSYGDLTYICQVKMPAISGTQDAAIVFRYQDANNFYSLVLWNNNLILRKTAGGTTTALNSAAVTLSANTWYWLRVQVQGSRLTGWLSTDGKTWSNQIQATDSTFTNGAIGIRDTSLAAQYKQPTVYTGVTPAIPVRPGVGPTLAVGQEVFVERVNFNGQDLLVDMPRVI
jgi:hypothetical protein